MQLKSIQALTVTPEQAQVMLNEWKYDRQRLVNHNLVKFYADQMRGGEFLPYSEIAVAWAINGDGKLHGNLINGQHRLHAVVKSGVEQQFTLKEYYCKTWDEVAMLYGSTDIGKARNINDLLRAHGENNFGLGKSQISSISSAVTLIHSNFGVLLGKYTLSPTRRLEIVERYIAPAKLFFAVFGGAEATRYLSRNAGSLAVALVTFDESIKIYGEAKVTDFWHGISANDGLRRGDPRKVLVDFVVQRAIRPNVGQTRATPQYIARYVSNCWNAWVTNREITSTKVMDVKSPILIRGTRWNGVEPKQQATVKREPPLSEYLYG